MSEIRTVNSLNDLIGENCTCNYKGENEWNENNTVSCEIMGFDIEIEESFPYRISVAVKLLPLEKIDNDSFVELQTCGVGLDDIIFY